MTAFRNFHEVIDSQIEVLAQENPEWRRYAKADHVVSGILSEALRKEPDA
jgi:hypothetical protein